MHVAYKVGRREYYVLYIPLDSQWAPRGCHFPMTSVFRAHLQGSLQTPVPRAD